MLHQLGQTVCGCQKQEPQQKDGGTRHSGLGMCCAWTEPVAKQMIDNSRDLILSISACQDELEIEAGRSSGHIFRCQYPSVVLKSHIARREMQALLRCIRHGSDKGLGGERRGLPRVSIYNTSAVSCGMRLRRDYMTLIIGGKTHPAQQALFNTLHSPRQSPSLEHLKRCFAACGLQSIDLNGG